MEAFLTHTSRLCQERCESSDADLDYGPPPLAADWRSRPEPRSPESENQVNPPSSTFQGPDPPHLTGASWNPLSSAPLSDARLEPIGEAIPGPLEGHLDQSQRVSSILPSTPTLLGFQATPDSPYCLGGLGFELVDMERSATQVSGETSPTSPSQWAGEGTTTSIDNSEGGSPNKKGHTAVGSDEDTRERDPTRSKPIDIPAQFPKVGSHSPTTLLDIAGWPQLPELGAQSSSANFCVAPVEVLRLSTVLSPGCSVLTHPAGYKHGVRT